MLSIVTIGRALLWFFTGISLLFAGATPWVWRRAKRFYDLPPPTGISSGWWRALVRGFPILAITSLVLFGGAIVAAVLFSDDSPVPVWYRRTYLATTLVCLATMLSVDFLNRPSWLVPTSLPGKPGLLAERRPRGEP